jgi:hypothetical protein
MVVCYKLGLLSLEKCRQITNKSQSEKQVSRPILELGSTRIKVLEMPILKLQISGKPS